MADEIIIEGETLEIDLPPHPVKNTIVTGIVKDRDGIVWINCGWKAVLVGYVGAPPIYSQDGTRVQTSFGGTVAPDGTFTGTLPANDAMIPPKTKWRITFFPLAVSASSTFDLAVTGANQNINTIITQNIVPPRFKLIPGNFGYDDSEISPQPKAGTPSCSYLNTTTGNLRIWNGTNFVDVTTGALPANAVQLMPHINAGNVQFTGGVAAGGDSSIGGNFSVAKGVFLGNQTGGTGLLLLFENGAQTLYDSLGATPTSLGEHLFRLVHGDNTNQTPVFEMLSTGCKSYVPFSAAALNINNVATIDSVGVLTLTQGLSVGWGVDPPQAGTRTYAAYLYTISTATKLVCSGDGGSYGHLEVWGFAAGGLGMSPAPYFTADSAGLHVTGTITATGAKTFVIPHPLKPDTHQLIHACLEGAETAVYYRGESRTDSKGLCTIELPAYFEALTALEGRTVLLTVIDTDTDGKNPIAMLAASRIKDGAFRVRSDIEFISFYWEVKAVRKDIAPLEVEVLREKEAPDAATS